MRGMSELVTRVAGADPQRGPAAATAAAEQQAAALVHAWVGRSGSPGALLDRIGGVDQVGVNERIDALKTRSIKKAVQGLGARPRASG